jgi:hypothetical protein
MKLAFYKAQYGTFFDKLIGFWTHGPYSHVELVFPTLTPEGLLKWGQADVAFSSSNRDGGTRFKAIPFDEHWDLLEVPCTESQDAAAWKLADSLKGRPYDWAGVFGFGSPFAISNQDPAKWFCSEVATYILKMVGIAPMKWPPSGNVDPNELYALALKLGWKPTR